jgi:YgiT-type zinc finger domain-containing protein
MRCFFCKGEMVEGLTTDVTDLGTSVIIIRGVPCQKCTQCGEVSFSLNVAERLEQIVDTLGESVTEIAVIRYSGAAA